MSFFVQTPETILRQIDFPAHSNAKVSLKMPVSLHDVLGNVSTEGSLVSGGRKKPDQVFLDNLLQKMLKKPKTMQLAFLTEKGLFQKRKVSRFIVIFLWQSERKTAFETYFLDFDSRRWLGLERLERRNESKVLLDLTEYLKRFPEDSAFLLFDEFLLMRREELLDLKRAMKDQNLVYVEFCPRNNGKANNEFIKEGDTEMKPRSEIFSRVKSNREMDSGLIEKLSVLDFEFGRLKNLGKKIGEIRTNLNSLKNKNAVEILAAGLGNYQEINSEIDFTIFLKMVKEMSWLNSPFLFKKSRLYLRAFKVGKKILKDAKKPKMPSQRRSQYF